VARLTRPRAAGTPRRSRCGPAAHPPQRAGRPQLPAAAPGFFTCGFHIAFLVTHLPGEVDLCGLPPEVASWSLAIIGLANIFGSLYAGACVSRYRSKHVLAVMYASRVVLIGGYLLLPPPPDFYVFAAGLGFTWLATVPPTASLVGKLFGCATWAPCSASPCCPTRSAAFSAPGWAGWRWSSSATTAGCGTPTWRWPPWRPSSICRSAKPGWRPPGGGLNLLRVLCRSAAKPSSNTPPQAFLITFGHTVLSMCIGPPCDPGGRSPCRRGARMIRIPP
jgi:hypothetical protein